MSTIIDLGEKTRAALLGLAVGDALGVPVEFRPRSVLDADPVTGMRAGGPHDQPAGTWSDDTSLALCLADSLVASGPEKLDLQDMARRMVAWYQDKLWTARGTVFDIGLATRQAIGRMAGGENPLFCGNTDEQSNGNGSLMRILPLAFWLLHKDPDTRRKACFQVSALTHGHPRSQLACWLWVETALHILSGQSLAESLILARRTIEAWLPGNDPDHEWEHFDRCVPEIAHEPRDRIISGGYVMDTLEASLWCLFNSTDYAGAVLMAVNLGSDTDTTAAVTGGLAGILHGPASIPAPWLDTLARCSDIESLSASLATISEGLPAGGGSFPG